MSSATELMLKLKIAQLEGKLALYESLISDLSNMETIQKVTVDIKTKLEDITQTWGSDHAGQNNGG
ncbi:MAG: hypothetical protein U9R15_09740 [Chloroflexota bacterium]|nr:hypothetical protein [Chloroflexota bacterium]